MARVAIAHIKSVVAAEFDMPEDIMTSPQQDRPTAHVRQVAMAIAYQLTPCSPAVIGRVFGGRDRTTVLYARDVVADRREKDSDLNHRIQRLVEMLRPAPVPRPEVQLSFLVGPLFDRMAA